jgi:ATP-dependent Clp protease ATP-binding subunit ClpB
LQFLDEGCITDSNGVVTPNTKEEVLERVREHFPLELLNRLDSMLVFNELSRESILAVMSLRLTDVAQGYSEVYGARAIARVVRTDVLFPVAQKLLRGTIRWVLCRLRLWWML